MARATLTESDPGARLDTIVDRDHVSGLLRRSHDRMGTRRQRSTRLALDGRRRGGARSQPVARRPIRRATRTERFVCFYRPIGPPAAHDSGRWALRAAASLFTLLRRDVFAVLFLFVSLTGRRALVPALVAFGVLLANFTFSDISARAGYRGSGRRARLRLLTLVRGMTGRVMPSRATRAIRGDAPPIVDPQVYQHRPTKHRRHPRRRAFPDVRAGASPTTRFAARWPARV